MRSNNNVFLENLKMSIIILTVNTFTNQSNHDLPSTINVIVSFLIIQLNRVDIVYSNLQWYS